MRIREIAQTRVCHGNPNERPEPTPFSFFDLSDRLFVLTRVHLIGFNDGSIQFAGVRTEGFYDPLKEFFVRGAVLQKLIEPPQSFGCIPVAYLGNEL